MASDICYIKLNRKYECKAENVFLKDIANLYCTDKQALEKIKSIRIVRYSDKTHSRHVISIIKIIALIQKQFPEMTVESLGETDTLIEHAPKKKENGKFTTVKIIAVSVISFFGTAFTIMAYHNDIGITKVFSQIYSMLMEKEPAGITVMEVCYSAGLAAGIILFFNHIGGKRITQDPTPIEVEMRKYEKDVEDTLADVAEKKGKTIDA